MMEAEKLAKLFHEIYEELAPSYGYVTREESVKPWKDVPGQNKKLMTAVCERILSIYLTYGAESTKTARVYCNSVLEFAHRVVGEVSEETKDEITKKLFELLFEGFSLIDRKDQQVQALIKLATRLGWDGVNNSKLLSVFIETKFQQLQANKEQLEGELKVAEEFKAEVTELEERIKVAIKLGQQRYEFLRRHNISPTVSEAYWFGACACLKRVQERMGHLEGEVNLWKKRVDEAAAVVADYEELKSWNERYAAAINLALCLDDVESIKNILRPLKKDK